MCDHCDNISRRELLKISAAALAGTLLAGCEAPQAVDDLPLAYDDHLLDDHPGPPVKIDPKTIQVPPPTPPEPSDYGAILPRKAWTTVPLNLKNGRSMDGVERITIHHSGDGRPFLETDQTAVAKHLQVVQQAHLQRGMIDIAYHFAVDRVGRLWQLRWLAYEGQHVRPSSDRKIFWNQHNIGIVALGDFNLQSTTVAQRDRLLELVRLVQKKYAVPYNNIKMHGELVQTDCPGKRLMPLLKDARAKHLL